MSFIVYEIKNVSSHLNSNNVTGIETLGDIVRFNEEHAAKVLPTGKCCQSLVSSKAEMSDHRMILIKTGFFRGSMIDPTRLNYEADVAHFRQIGRTQGGDKLFADEILTTLAFPTDCIMFDVAAAVGRSQQSFQSRVLIV